MMPSRFDYLFPDEEQQDISPVQTRIDPPIEQEDVTGRFSHLFSGGQSATVPKNQGERERDRTNFWDSMPLVYKQAYNDSIGGIMHEMMTGKKYYSLSNSPKSLTRDIAAGFLSFFSSKEDLAVLAAGIFTGGTATAAARAAIIPVKTAAQKRAAVMLAKRGGLKIKTAKGLVDDVIRIGGTQAFVMGTHDGLYSAAKDARNEILASEKDLSEYKNKNYGEVLGLVLKESDPKDFFRGGVLGLAGGIGRTSRYLTPIKGTKAALSGAGVKGQKFFTGTGTQTKGFVGEALTFGGVAPILYEGRAPEFQDFAIAGGIVGALTLPFGVFRGAKRISKQKMIDEINTTPEAKKAAYQDVITTDKAVIFEQAKGQQPFRKWADISPAQRREIKREHRFTLDGEDYALVNIRGREVRRKRALAGEDVAFSGKGGKVEKKVSIDPIERNIPFVKAKIVDGSINQTQRGLKMQVDVQGIGRYHLDEINTELFFNFHASNPTIIKNFEKNIGGLAQRRRALEELNTKELQDLRKKTIAETDGYSKQDWDNAIKDIVDFNTVKVKGKPTTTKFHRWARTLEAGKSIEIANMNAGEKYLVAKMVRNQKIIREFLNKNSAIYDINYLYQTTAWKDKGIFSKTLAPFRPFYYHLRDPYLKKATRLINNVNMGTQQQTATRLMNLNRILKADRNYNLGDKNWWGTSKWWKEYLGGEAKGNTAWKDFNDIRAMNVKSPGNGVKLWLKKMDDKIKRAKEGSVEQERLKARRFLVEQTSGPKKFDEKGNLIWRSYSDEIWDDAISANLRLAPKVDGYLPLMFKKEVLDVMFDTMSTMEQKVLALTKKAGEGFDIDGNYTKETLQKLNTMLENLVKSFDSSKKPGEVQFKRIWDSMSTQLAPGPVPESYNVFRVLNHNMYTHSLRPFSPLEKPRKLANFEYTSQNVTKIVARTNEELIEKNFIRLMTEYTGGSTKRIELSKAFTPTGSYFEELMNKADGNLEMRGFKLGKIFGGHKLPMTVQTEKEAVRMIKEVFSGEINFSKSTPLSKSFQTISNLEMMGKISLGYATIPNMTQTFISTAVEGGMFNTAKSIFKLATDVKVRKRVQDSGATILTAFDELMVQDKALQIGAARLMKIDSPTKEFVRGKLGFNDGVTWLTKKTAYLFTKVNQGNQMVAAATAEGLVQKLATILKGKKKGLGLLDTVAPKKRKQWAQNKLKRLGLSEKEVLKNYDAIMSGRYGPDNQIFRQKLIRSMEKFSLQSQLQRDFTLDPILFHDPMLKPLLLFKRFGYRQLMYMQNILKREFIDGNVMPFFNLALGGFAGGQAVMWAKEKLNQVLSGEPQFYGKENRAKLLKEDVMFQDVINSMSNVGAFGVMSDVLTDDDPVSSIKFYLKPVVVDDFMRVVKSFDTFRKSMDTHYPAWDVPARRAVVGLAPIAGGPVTRLTRRALETEKMTKDRIRNQKARAVETIRDYIIAGKHKAAQKMYVDFNNTYGGLYPSLVIKSSDVSYKAIAKRWTDRIKKQQEEKQYIP